LGHSSFVAEPIERSRARLELQENRRMRLQALLSEAQDAYQDALAQVRKSFQLLANSLWHASPPSCLLLEALEENMDENSFESEIRV